MKEFFLVVVAGGIGFAIAKHRQTVNAIGLTPAATPTSPPMLIPGDAGFPVSQAPGQTFKGPKTWLAPFPGRRGTVPRFGVIISNAGDPGLANNYQPVPGGYRPPFGPGANNNGGIPFGALSY